MNLLHVLALTRAVGESVSPREQQPEVYRWTDAGAIWRVLSRRGFITPQPHKRPRSSWHRFAAELPNELWQADITHWPLAENANLVPHTYPYFDAASRGVDFAGMMAALASQAPPILA